MKTIIILGAGQFGRAASRLLSPEALRLLAYADNNPSLQGTGIASVPVLPFPEAIALRPDFALTGVTDPERTAQLTRQALEAGFTGEFLLLSRLYENFDIRSATLTRLAERIEECRVPGDIAELGVYRGALARCLSRLFPNRTLYLFDTFRGFDPRDVAVEMKQGRQLLREGEFADTAAGLVLASLPHPEKAVIRQGYFPETAAGLEGKTFALVSLDPDLYAPILAGLEFFYPRLAPGGMILLHDFNNSRFRGAHQAVLDYEKARSPLPLTPLCDLHGSAVIQKPFS